MGAAQVKGRRGRTEKMSDRSSSTRTDGSERCTGVGAGVVGAVGGVVGVTGGLIGVVG